MNPKRIAEAVTYQRVDEVINWVAMVKELVHSVINSVVMFLGDGAAEEVAALFV